MSLLNRKVKARTHTFEEEEDEDNYDMEEGSSPSVLETGDAGDILSSDEEGEDIDQGDGDEDDDAPQQDPQAQLRSISFGTLARAQDSLFKKRKRDSDSTPQQEDKLEALRARLRELKESKTNSTKEKSVKESKDGGKKSQTHSKHKQDVAKELDNEEDEDDNDSDSAPEEVSHSRSSKHAPSSKSSKHQVTRKRTVVEVPKNKVRDPRFGPMAGEVDDTRVDRNYSFLHSYADDEISELKTALKKTKNEDDKEKLKRALMGMENQKRARADKERQQAVLREHRKKEKEAIAAGKNPFYLKRGELKKQALVSKYEGMKGKERTKAIDRKRKKESQREKKSMPAARRVVG